MSNHHILEQQADNVKKDFLNLFLLFWYLKYSDKILRLKTCLQTLPDLKENRLPKSKFSKPRE